MATNYNESINYNAAINYNGTITAAHHGSASLEWDEEQFRLWLEGSKRIVIDAEEDDLIAILGTLYAD